MDNNDNNNFVNNENNNFNNTDENIADSNQHVNAENGNQFSQDFNTQYQQQNYQQQNFQHFQGQNQGFQPQFQQPQQRNNFTNGQIGEVRNPIMMIVLTIVTCGIYGLIWHYKVSKEINDFTKTEMTSPTFAIVGIFCFIFAYINYYKIDQAIVAIDNVEGRRSESRFILWILLSILAGVGTFMMIYQVQESLNNIWYAHGAPRQQSSI